MADSVSVEQMVKASGLTAEEIAMLGRIPYKLLVPHPTSGRFRLSQVSWARKLAELRREKGWSWLEIRSWAEARQQPRGRAASRAEAEDESEDD
jgi:hypothetical protein